MPFVYFLRCNITKKQLIVLCSYVYIYTFNCNFIWIKLTYFPRLVNSDLRTAAQHTTICWTSRPRRCYYLWLQLCSMCSIIYIVKTQTIIKWNAYCDIHFTAESHQSSGDIIYTVNKQFIIVCCTHAILHILGGWLVLSQLGLNLIKVKTRVKYY